MLYGRNQHNIVNFKKQKLKNQHILKKKKRLKQGRRMWTSSLIRRNISFLTSTWLVLGSSGLWEYVHTYGMATPPFKQPSYACAEEKSSLTSRIGTLSFYFSRAQLLPLAWSVWVRTKLQSYSTWQTPAVQPRGPSISYLSCKRGWYYVNKITLWLLKHNMSLKYKCYLLLLDNI